MSPNLTANLVGHLRERITSGDLAPGDKLPSESELMAAHGVSRTVVREAITRLQAEGLVHTRRGAGSFALTPPADDPAAASAPRTLDERRHLLAFRMGVETEAAARAAGRTDPATRASLTGALAALRAAGSHPGQAMTSDYEFHLAIARASGNPYFVDAVERFGPALITMPRRRLTAAARAEHTMRLERVAAEHESILAAITSGDPQAAAAAMRTHLVNSLHRLETEANGG
ncbi:FadR family transcriptional regulator [Micrococcales bacterium 31B]|nr:FadR family transcriptional regulator [Micrococcales bacterium 31B]